MKVSFIIYVLMATFLLSCSGIIYHQKPDSFIREQRTSNEISTINFSGFYHHIRDSNYHLGTDYKNGLPTRYIDTPYADKPILFFSNGLVAYSYRLYFDSIGFVNNQIKFGTQEKSYINDWGVYQIEKDTIRAEIYLVFGMGLNFHGRFQRLICNFQGILKNRDTILNWHLVPPFPQNPTYAIDGTLFDNLKKPKDLFFKRAPISELISPENAWINKLRYKK
ncbi:MAG: hypothetical protein Q8941_16680 [Bacteroidota bacterium]|nr:hypothetical protein [Bacteroidota bacterium]